MESLVGSEEGLAGCQGAGQEMQAAESQLRAEWGAGGWGMH